MSVFFGSFGLFSCQILTFKEDIIQPQGLNELPSLRKNCCLVQFFKISFEVSIILNYQNICEPSEVGRKKKFLQTLTDIYILKKGPNDDLFVKLAANASIFVAFF